MDYIANEIVYGPAGGREFFIQHNKDERGVVCTLSLTAVKLLPQMS